MTDREQFEIYMRSRNPCVRLSRQSEKLGGRYRTTTVERMWDLWAFAWAASNREASESAPGALIGLPVIDPDLLGKKEELSRSELQQKWDRIETDGWICNEHDFLHPPNK